MHCFLQLNSLVKIIELKFDTAKSIQTIIWKTKGVLEKKCFHISILCYPCMNCLKFSSGDEASLYPIQIWIQQRSLASIHLVVKLIQIMGHAKPLTNLSNRTDCPSQEYTECIEINHLGVEKLRLIMPSQRIACPIAVLLTRRWRGQMAKKT